MKVAPVLRALERRGIRTTLVHTGQHYDAEMSEGFFEELGLREPDYWLEVGCVTPAEYGLVTLHRPANVDDGAVLKDLLNALAAIAVDLPLIIPAHPRARARLDEIGVPTGLTVIDPLGYLDFLALEAGARIVLTD